MNKHCKDASAALRLPHIGLRKVKSILAIFVGFWLWQLVRLAFPDLEVHPIYIYIYSMIEIRDSSNKTVDLGSRRIKATFTAMGIGLPILALAEFLKDLPFFAVSWARIGLDLALLLFGVLLTLLIAEKVGCKTFCGLAAAIFIILLISHADGERYFYCILRAGQTLVGVFIAWLINVKLLPYPGPSKAKEAEPAPAPESTDIPVAAEKK